MHEKYSLIIWSRAITFVVNTLKKIHLSTNIFNELTSTSYDDKNYDFGFLFRHYIDNSVYNIDPDLIEECKSNMYTEAYEININNRVYKPYKKRELYRIIDEQYWPTMMHK